MHWHFLLNVVVALVLGIAIGPQRQWRQHQAAGFLKREQRKGYEIVA